jgi:hypothetical protein
MHDAKSDETVTVWRTPQTLGDDMSMRTTVTIEKDILDELVHESGHKNKAAAV